MASPLAYRGGTERPIKATGELSPSDLTQKSAASARQWERATHRFHVARFAATVAREWSNAGRQAAVERAMKAGVIPAGPLLSKEQIRLLVQQWDRGDQSIEDYRDGRRRSGLRPLAVDDRLQAVVEAAVQRQRAVSGAAVRREMQEAAEDVLRTTGEVLRVPSAKRVRQMIARLGRALRSAARHGAAAAEIDGLPHSTVPADYVHHIHSLDELTLNRWAAMWDPFHPDGARFVSFKPEVVFIIEHVSRACVGYWVADPARRTNVRTRETKTSGFDADDVLAAILSAAFPQVATVATRAFAGYRPAVLRWDNAKAHSEPLRDGLMLAGICVPELPIHRPINRGIVERAIGTLKRFMDRTRLPGHEDRYIPADRVRVDGEVAQAEAAGLQHRRTTRTVIAVEDLPRIEEVREEIETVIRYYNFRHRHRGLGLDTPFDAYQRALPRRAVRDDPTLQGRQRPAAGRDLLVMLPAETTRVTPEGVVHRGKRFSFEIATPAGPAWMALGTPVTYRADPMGRALYAEIGERVECLPPLEHWARGQMPAQIAEQQTNIARTLEARARNARTTADALELGAAALARGEAAGRDALAQAARRGGGAGRADADVDGGEADDAPTDLAPPPEPPTAEGDGDPFADEITRLDPADFEFHFATDATPAPADATRQPRRRRAAND